MNEESSDQAIQDQLRRERDEARREIEHLNKALEQLEADCAAMREALGMSTPWPIQSVLTTARDWLNHLSHHHNCDCHGWESAHACVEAITKMGPKINAALK